MFLIHLLKLPNSGGDIVSALLSHLSLAWISPLCRWWGLHYTHKNTLWSFVVVLSSPAALVVGITPGLLGSTRKVVAMVAVSIRISVLERWAWQNWAKETIDVRKGKGDKEKRGEMKFCRNMHTNLRTLFIMSLTFNKVNSKSFGAHLKFWLSQYETVAAVQLIDPAASTQTDMWTALCVVINFTTSCVGFAEAC